MLVTEGMVTDVKPEQKAKAFSPMLVTVVGTLISSPGHRSQSLLPTCTFASSRRDASAAATAPTAP